MGIRVIGQKKFEVTETELLQQDLLFYLDNPRVYSVLHENGHDNPTQTEIEEIMCSLDHVKSLKSQIMQNTAPMKNVPGIITIGFDVPKAFLARNGTAIPTNEIGPAKAVTQADNILDKRMRIIRNALILTPMLCAYASPN